MRLKLLLFLVSFISFNLLAHDSKEAFFVIEQKGDLVEVNAEFPWTLRNALLAFDPGLNEAKDKADYEAAFFKYIKSAFHLINSKGDLLELIKVSEIVNVGHSHQNNFLLIFQGKNIAKVKNEIMFNIYDRQTNYHTALVEGEKIQFTTTVHQAEFILMEQYVNQKWWFVLLLIPLGYLIVRGVRKKVS